MSPTGTLAPSGPLTAAAGRPRRTRRRVLVAAALGVAVIGTAGWWTVAGERLDDVHVIAAPNGVACRTGEVRLPRPELPLRTSNLTATVMATPGLDCTVTLLVVNDGDDPVELRRLEVPVMGPATGAGLQVVEIGPYGPVVADPAAGPEYDAIVSVRDVLPPGDVRQVVLVLAYNDDGCAPAGGAVTPYGPFLEVSALGRTGVRSPLLPPFSVGGTAATDGPCDSAPRD